MAWRVISNNGQVQVLDDSGHLRASFTRADEAHAYLQGVTDGVKEAQDSFDKTVEQVGHELRRQHAVLAMLRTSASAGRMAIK